MALNICVTSGNLKEYGNNNYLDLMLATDAGRGTETSDFGSKVSGIMPLPVSRGLSALFQSRTSYTRPIISLSEFIEQFDVYWLIRKTLARATETIPGADDDVKKLIDTDLTDIQKIYSTKPESVSYKVSWDNPTRIEAHPKIDEYVLYRMKKDLERI